MSEQRLLLLDTASLYFRAYFGVPDTMRAPDGTPVNAVRGTLDFIARGTGRWAAEALPPQRGQWEARLTLYGPDGTPFDIRRRLIAP